MFKQFQHTSESHDSFLFRKAVFISLSSSFLMWAIKLYEWTGDKNLSFLGIYPRTLKGSIGIITSPFIHSDVFHLFSNTIPYISLTLILFYFYSKKAWEIFIWIYLTTGVWVWAFARQASHIGASGIIYGLASFLLLSGFLTKNIRLISISLIVLFLYGGMFYGISPTTVSEDTSWESHLLGAISGAIFAIFFKPKTKKHAPITSDNPNQQINTTADQPINIIYHYKEKPGDNN